MVNSNLQQAEPHKGNDKKLLQIISFFAEEGLSNLCKHEKVIAQEEEGMVTMVMVLIIVILYTITGMCG